MSDPTADDQRRVLTTAETVAVVGASTDERKDAHTVPRYLRDHGFRIVPVSPNHHEILGQRAFPSLRDVDIPIDVVEVFRPASEAPQIARDAVAIGAKVLWLQPGIISDEAAQIAEENGLTVFMDICMRATHILLGLGDAEPG